ncbi:alpha/beta hydrolase [Streptomyces bauhiniae]|uniref:alpha/beta hydrolase n=1 Tax=Streptomyces bauhiniae TaxID=2340725 RepID=UPI0033A94081
MDIKTLKTLTPSEYAQAADGYRAVSDMADAARERIDTQITGGLRKANEGEAADAAQKQLKKLSANFHYAQVECGLISGALNGFSSEIAAPRRCLTEALEDASALGYTVGANGDVTYPAGGKNQLTGDEVPGGTAVGNNGMLSPSNRGLHGPGGKGLYTPSTGAGVLDIHYGNPHHAKAQDIADRIAHAVREATEIDERYSGALAKLKAAPGLSVTTKTWADAASDVDAVESAARQYLQDTIPLDKSPADRKKWWDGLNSEEQDEYRRAFPELIGNLDGVPAEVRDEANRENLGMLMTKLDGQHDEKSKTMLDGLKSIDGQLRNPDPASPPMYLLGIGDEGNGRAIVSYGNPDASKNTSAYVPGLGTALDSDFAKNDLKRARDTAIDAQKYDSSSASIIWLGYDAPQMPADEVLHNPAVMLKQDARVGATAYNEFMAGVSATNEHSDPHITAIGHSYGSLTVGQAAQRHGGIPGADDIILLGSPGTGADRAEDLNVGKEHVFVGAAENDPVSHLPSKLEAAVGLGSGSYILGDIVDQGDDDLWFGKDPASEAFGARRFTVDDGPRPFIDGQGPTPAHSNYFNPEKDLESADNIAKIVAGQSDHIKVERWR